MDLQMAGKRYLVVGGSSGIGFAAARAIVDEGASVVIVGRDESRLGAAVDRLSHRANGVSGDVSAERGADRVVERAVSLLGGLDGVAVTTGLIGHEPIGITDERWVEVFRDVMLGTSRTVEACLPYLIESRGSIVTTAAYSIRAPEIARLPYASMKSAVATFTKGIAKAHGKDGVRANCIAPGAIETEALARLRVQMADARGYPLDEALERVMTDEWHLDIALRRPGRPAEVGALIAFVLSPVAGYLTGSLINIDGGTNF